MTGGGGRRRARDGGDAYAYGAGPDQRRDNGSRREDALGYAGGGGRPPHEYERGGGGPAGSSSRNGSTSAAIPSAHAQPHWERDRSREPGDRGGGSIWEQRGRDRYRSGGGGGGAGGRAEFGSDALARAGHGGGGSAVAGVSRAGAGAGGNANYGLVDAFGRALQKSTLGRAQTDSGAYNRAAGGASASTSSASTSKASFGRSSSAVAAISHTKDYLRNRGVRTDGKDSSIGGRNFPWQSRDVGASAAHAYRPPTPPIPPGGKLPLPKAKVASAARPHQSQSQLSQQHDTNSKDYDEYRRSVQKRNSSQNAGGGGANHRGSAASAASGSGGLAADTLDKLKAITKGNARAGDPTASSAADVASITATSTIAAKPQPGGATAKNAPLPDMKAASVARKRQPTRNEMLRNMAGARQSTLKSVKSMTSTFVSKVGTKAKHPPPSGSGHVSPARGNRLLSATVDKATKKMMASKFSAAMAGGKGQGKIISAAESPKGKTETRKETAQQVPSNKPTTKRVGRAAAAMSKENHSVAHQHDGPVEVCAVGKQQHTGRIIPTVSGNPKFVEAASAKLPGEGKSSSTSADEKPKPGAGKSKGKVVNKVAARTKAIKEKISLKAGILSRPRAAVAAAAAAAAAAEGAKHSSVTSTGSLSPGCKISVPSNAASPQTSGDEKIDPNNAGGSIPAGTDKASFSSVEEARAMLMAKKRQLLALEVKQQKPGTIFTTPKVPSDDKPNAGTRGIADVQQASQKPFIDVSGASTAKTSPAGETDESSNSICVAGAGPSNVVCGNDSHSLSNTLESNRKYRSLIQERKGEYNKAESGENRKIAATASQGKATCKVADGNEGNDSIIFVGENRTNAARKLPSSTTSVPSKDVVNEEKKDDGPDGDSVGGSKMTKDEDAPEVVLIDQAAEKGQIRKTKDSGNDEIICIDESSDEDKVSTKEKIQKKAINDNDSVVDIGSSCSSASSLLDIGASSSSSSSDSDVKFIGEKKSEGEVKSEQAWYCDFCDEAVFTDEEDAIAHEKVCTCRRSIAAGSDAAEMGNTKLNAVDAATLPGVSAASEASAGAQATNNSKDDDYDSSDDERSLQMKPIKRALFESSQSSSEGDGKSGMPTTIDVKPPSPPQPSDKPMQDTPMTQASDESDEEVYIPVRNNNSPPRLSCKAMASPLKDRYVGSSARLAVKASLEAEDDASKKRILDRSKAVSLDGPKKKKHKRLSSSSGSMKKASPKLPLSTPFTHKLDPDTLNMMEAVPHLTRTELDDATGKPVSFFTVYNLGGMDILYDFKVTIRQSQIPNSGYGAFLTYLGARLLNEERRGRTYDVLYNSSGRPPDVSLKPLEATFRRTKPIFPESHRATVILKGENLDEYGGEEYWADTQNDLFAVINGSKKIKIKLTDNNNELHDNGQDLLASRNLKPGEVPIGFRKLQREAHYEKVPIPFCSYYRGCGLIDLGRYGPFRRSDRKTELEFGIKDFIFEHEPSGWMFGVDAKLRGEDQNIDITDDRTGETHIDAQEHIPMYVNEVGYSKELVENVLPREITGREVHYFLHLRHHLEEGQEVELLTNYLKPYEPMRERKGYGRANIYKGVKSDYDCTKTRTLRNLCERYFMDDTIESLNTQECINSLRFIDEKILRPVVTSTEWYIDKAQKSVDYADSHGIGRRLPKTQPPSRQWIARRRVHWFHGRYTDKILELKRNNEISDKDAQDAEAIVKRMRWVDLSTIFPFMNEIKIWSGKTLGKGVQVELQEEIYYMASKDLCGLFEACLWCPRAEQLAQDISFILACVLLSQKSASMETDLSMKILEAAKRDGSFIKKSCEALANKQYTLENREKMCKILEFQSEPRATGNGKQTPSFDRLHRLFEIDTKNVGQKTKSVIIAKCTSDAATDVNAKKPFVSNESVINVSEPGVSAAAEAIAVNLPPKLEARDAAEFPDGNISPNVAWYLQLQVAYVIDSLARSFDEIWSRDSGGDRLNWYSLETLCNRLGLDYEETEAVLEHTRAKASTIAQFTMQTVADDDDDDDEMDGSDYKTPKKRSHRQSKKGKARSPLSTSTSGSQRPKSNKKLFNGTIWKTLEDDLGWRVEIKGREKGRNDFYFFPPGATWGMKKRQDFFDSVPLVVDFIKTDPRWKDNPKVKGAIDRYERSIEHVETLRDRRKLPKAYDVEWLLKHMDDHADEKPAAAK